MERASRLLARCPAKRLEFQLELTRGMLAHFLGDASTAKEAFERAIPLGRGLADVQFTGFAEVYLAEAELACGHYGAAARRLRRIAAVSLRTGPPILLRMAHARLFVVEELLGRGRPAEVSRKVLDTTTRTDMALLEAWNDLFIALGRRLAGGLPSPGSTLRDSEAGDDGRRIEALLQGALKTFHGLGIPAGSRLVHVGLLQLALSRSDTQHTRASLRRIESAGETPHKLLSVLEPLARAEASFVLGELDRAEEALSAAGCAIVGLPFLELDCRIEALRARLADRQGDREGARRHIHRSRHTRELLARSVSGRDRDAFLAHPRFSSLEDLAARLERPRITPLGGKTSDGGSTRHGMASGSPAMARVHDTIDRLRDQEIPVLITGETGTGKELVARAIHESSPRRRGPFVALHCGSLPSELFEAELFGYEAGAFTGADEPRQGLLEHFAGGTLLLDEVAGLSLEVQTKLLRVLDTKVVRPLGGLSVRPADVRFLASSSADLEAGVAGGTFRADLYFRIRGVEIAMPPLRARKDDIPLLVRRFLALHSRRLERPVPIVTRAALNLLESHDWPGNVRELETLIVRVLVTSSPGAALDAEALRRLMPRRNEQSVFSEEVVAGRDLKQLRKELERVYLVRLFRDSAGDITKMTRALGVKTSRLYAWFRETGIDVSALRREL